MLILNLFKPLEFFGSFNPNVCKSIFETESYDESSWYQIVYGP